MAKLIQREGRPALDISPDATPTTASWDASSNPTDPMNPCNEAVPVRKGGYPPNGWQDNYTRVSITTTDDADGVENVDPGE